MPQSDMKVGYRELGFWQWHHGQCLDWVHETLKERLSSVTTRSRVTSVTRPMLPRSTGVKTPRFGTGYYIIRANKMLLIAECPRQVYTYLL
jgi:hypothetical protein